MGIAPAEMRMLVLVRALVTCRIEMEKNFPGQPAREYDKLLDRVLRAVLLKVEAAVTFPTPQGSA